MLYWENTHIFRGNFTRLCFKLNNLTGQKFGMSEVKLRWPVTLTGDPPAVTVRPGQYSHFPWPLHIFLLLSEDMRFAG